MFREKAMAAIFKDLQQLNNGMLHRNPIIVPLDIESLPVEDKRKALEAVNLITVKRKPNVEIVQIARAREISSKLRIIFASPTASLESILTTLMVDDIEERYVVVACLPGAYIHAKFSEDKKVVLKFTGVFVKIILLQALSMYHTPQYLTDSLQNTISL